MQVTALGPVPVKGLVEPVEVFELLGASGVRRRLQAAARGLTRFVGRDLELVVIQQALAQASAGHGQVVALLGEDPSLAPLTPLLIARTQGNPFFLEESVRTLVETGVLVGTPGAYRLAQALATIQVPATVQAAGGAHRPLTARGKAAPPDRGRHWHRGALAAAPGHCGRA